MSIILSLQGCMAAGKTTAARHVQQYLPHIHVSYENPTPIIRQVHQQGLDQHTLEGFIAIQRLFIQAEIQRWQDCQAYEHVLMDMGADEIEFYTLFYPRSQGNDWDMEDAIKDDLAALRQCRFDGRLFLDASSDTLIRNKEQDTTRSRNSFAHYLSTMYPYKKAWFQSQAHPPTQFLPVDGMSPNQLGQKVCHWIQTFIAKSDSV